MGVSELWFGGSCVQQAICMQCSNSSLVDKQGHISAAAAVHELAVGRLSRLAVREGNSNKLTVPQVGMPRGAAAL